MLNEKYFFPFLNMAFEAPNDDGSDPGDDPNDGKKDPEDILPDAEPGVLRQEIRKLRNENQNVRHQRTEIENKLKGFEEKLNKFKSVFGEDEELDPEKLKSKTQSLESELKAERVKNAVTIQAINEGLDPDLTIAYLQNKGSLKDLDHSDSESVSAVVSKAAKDKPNLKTKAPDRVGDGKEDEGTKTKKNLNPIDAYRQRVGILPSNGK